MRDRARQELRWGIEAVLVGVDVVWTLAVVILALDIGWPDVLDHIPWVATIVRELTAWALLIAMGGVGVALLAVYAGARRIGLVLTAVNVLATVVVLMPIVETARIAREHDASISLFENLTKVPNKGSPVPERSVPYVTLEGQQLLLDVWVPGSADGAPIPGAATGPRRPAVVRVHGGGWVGGDRSNTHLWNELLNDRGYAVFDIQYRLASDTQPRWDESAGDVLCAVGWVKAHAADYGIDPQRVALMGDSAGGELSLQAAYGTSGRPTVPSCPTPDPSVRAVVALYPGTEFVSLWQSNETDGLLRPWVEAYEGGTPSSVPDHYQGSSPVSQVPAGAPPTLALHGDRDTVVPVSQTHQLDDVLTKLGVDHEVVTVPLMDHGFDQSWHSLGAQIARDVVPRYLDQHTG